MKAWEYINQNLNEALRFFGQATGRGEVRDLEESLAIFSGIEYGVFNIALLNFASKHWTRGVESSADYFRPQARRWSVWLCENALDFDALRQVRAALEKQHMAEISRAPGMVLTEFDPPRRELPAIKPVPVDSAKLREAFGGLAAVCFDIPAGVSREVYHPARAWNGSYRGFVGMVAGRPVGIVALVRTGGTLGVYSLGIDPESRGLGYGEALLREAVALERAEGGVERVVLQSSEIAHSLYKHMGFIEAAQFSVHLKK